MGVNKKKIINDPVYGFITIPTDLIFDIIEHPYFQRLRRIKQLGLADLVYPGALHTRFHHAIGAMHLMGNALNTLRSKGHEISDQELEAAQIAILLHDIGHGPFSHALEHSLLKGIQHEKISAFIMAELNKKFNGALELSLQMFQNSYERKFFHQLISSQLDVDRLDYLNRDCFFTGVSEGTIALDRIIKMLDIEQDSLVVEEKGIYSIENFLNARRLMYWQVYLHKTAVSAEKMMIQIIKRAKFLVSTGNPLPCSAPLNFLLENQITFADFEKDDKYLENFAAVDDYDVWGAIKIWQKNNDFILSHLCSNLIERKLFKIEISNQEFLEEQIENLKNKITFHYKIPKEDFHYFLVNGEISNAAYIGGSQKINILTKNKQVVDVAEASDLPNIKAIRKIVKKHYLCYPKNVYL